MAIDRLKLALFLTDPENEWVRAIAGTAQEATRRRGFTLTTHFSQNQAIEQIQSLYAALRLPEDQRPNAVLVMPVHDQSLERVARAAATAGVAWICLHRATGDLAALRRQFPTVPITLVGPDQDEIGRIHGRQLLGLLPRGGHVLYVQGRHDNLSTQQRAAGMREVIQGSAVEISAVIDGDWGAMEAERSVSRWLRLIGPGTPVDVVVCQNDAMAIGARRGLKEAATALARPALAQLPVFGCDGLPDVGRKLVDQGELAGTIILPSPAITAIDTLVQALETKRMPAVQVLLAPQAYPARLSARGTSAESPAALPR
jgi:ABC-type sugar transport system substrate-binding protein